MISYRDNFNYRREILKRAALGDIFEEEVRSEGERKLKEQREAYEQKLSDGAVDLIDSGSLTQSMMTGQSKDLYRRVLIDRYVYTGFMNDNGDWVTTGRGRVKNFDEEGNVEVDTEDYAGSVWVAPPNLRINLTKREFKNYESLKSLKGGDSVIVKDPGPNDDWDHEFSGTVTNIIYDDNGNIEEVYVVDQDENYFSVSPAQISLDQ